MKATSTCIFLFRKCWRRTSRTAYSFFLLWPFFGTSLLAQDDGVTVEVKGDRKEAQKVFDAYEKLRTTMESYDATVEAVEEVGPIRDLKGKCEIAKSGNLYLVSTISNNSPTNGGPVVDIARDHYLDSSRGYHEETDGRKGIIRISKSRGDQSNPFDSRWSPLVAPFHAPIDRECFWLGSSYPFLHLFHPEKMKGTTRELVILTSSNGDVVLTRKFPPGREIVATASAEFGYLMVSLRDSDKEDEGRTEQMTYSWSKLPDGRIVPKSKTYSLDSPKIHMGQSWKVTRLTIPSTKTEFIKPSLNPPVGWKIIDTESKAEKIIGGEEGKRVRGLLDSVDRVGIGTVFNMRLQDIDRLNAFLRNFDYGAEDKTTNVSGVDCIFLVEQYFDEGHGDYAKLIDELGGIHQDGLPMDEIAKRLTSSGLVCKAVIKAVASDIWPEVAKAKENLVFVGHVSPNHLVILLQHFGDDSFLVLDPCVLRWTVIDQAAFSGNFLLVSKHAIPNLFSNQ